jgi:chromosome segregation ATPase
MTGDLEASELRRRISLAEQEIEGEKRVSRHILRKVTENENSLAGLRKEVSALRDEVILLRADLPAIISNVVGALLREERERSR